jgi:DNA polymerase-3 subunit beta
MNIVIHQTELKAGLAVVAGVVPNKPVMPVLGNIYLTTTDEGVEMRATDLHAAVVYTCSAKVVDAGTITVPAKLLVDIVNNLPAEPVFIENSAFTIFLKCGAFDCQINGLDPADFPELPNVSGDSITVDARPLADALIRSMSAVAMDDSRPVLTAVRMNVTPTDVSVVSADGFRLSKMDFPITEQAVTWNNVLIPAATIGLIIKAMPTTGTVTIARTDTMIQFVLPRVTYISRLIEGTYPDIERVFPKSFVNRMVVDAKELRQALKVARLIHTTVKIAIMDDHINLSANDSGRGNNRTTLQVQRSGETHTLALNVAYLDNAVAACMSNHVIIETTSETAPALVRPQGDEHYWHIVMPMHVR